MKRATKTVLKKTGVKKQDIKSQKGYDNTPKPLKASQLFTKCTFPSSGFKSSKDLESIDLGLGQSRAMEAINFSLGMEQQGYNLFVSGPSGVGKNEIIKALIESKRVDRNPPCDWCYVNNFARNNQPTLLKLPAGSARKLQKAMLQLIEELLGAVPSTFQSEEYLDAVREINDEFQSIEQELFEKLAEEAKAENVLLIPTPKGYTMGPSNGTQLIGSEEFNELPAKEQDTIKDKVEKYNHRLKDIVEKLPIIKVDAHKKVKDLNTWFTLLCIQPFFDDLKKEWNEEDSVKMFFESAQEDIVDNVGIFFRQDKDNTNISNSKFIHEAEYLPYHINIFVDNADNQQAPIIFEENPIHQNLFGQIEYTSYKNSLSTNFTLMQSGAVHRANGGYLVLDARKVLSKPFVWESLKRVLHTNQLSIEPVDYVFSPSAGQSLTPDLIPLDIKVVLIGDPTIHQLLKSQDPEFSSLFKVTADMSYDIARDIDNTLLYAKLIANKIKSAGLLPFNRAAIARLIEHSSRYASDSEKLSLNIEQISDLIQETNYYAKQKKIKVVNVACVEDALSGRLLRQSQYPDLFCENIARGDIVFNNTGDQVGEANALSVIGLGDFYFGRPTRISATARIGNGNVIDIEREADMAGSLHSKGVMILSAFIANRYSKDIPLALTATLVFEQSYGFIDGDSASAIELCALLSAISDIPIKQCFAVTGSVDQNGRVQAIGAVNEKIEGFYEACKVKGGAKDKAVIIPQANVKHLMLNKEIVTAAKKQEFKIYAVENIDQMLSLLTGINAGHKNDQGIYPVESVNGKVQSSINALSDKLKKLKGS
ncbi:MAG: AAA family ATPase [Pseudomonadales bacterium]|nr:AAA family ATPase [Pseudomonadales bacterium]